MQEHPWCHGSEQAQHSTFPGHICRAGHATRPTTLGARSASVSHDIMETSSKEHKQEHDGCRTGAPCCAKQRPATHGPSHLCAQVRRTPVVSLSAGSAALAARGTCAPPGAPRRAARTAHDRTGPCTYRLQAEPTSHRPQRGRLRPVANNDGLAHPAPRLDLDVVFIPLHV